MKFKSALSEATKIISVDLRRSDDPMANPKAGVHTTKVVHMDKSKEKIIPKILDKKEMAAMEYYVPDLPEGAWKSIPPEFRRFYHDFMNSYPEVTFQPHPYMAKFSSAVKRMKKKYPGVDWDKIFPKVKQIGSW